MNKKIRDHVTAFAITNNWATDDNTLMEIITEQNTIYSEEKSTHRWYIKTFNVVNVNGLLIGFDGYKITGDHNMHDMDLEYEIETFVEVEKLQKTIDYYIPKSKNQLGGDYECTSPDVSC